MVYHYTANTAQNLIRAVTSTLSLPGWDFLIYRCTISATTQASCQKFLSLLKADAEEILSAPEDVDLLAGFSLTVIEDPALEDAGWKEARDHFDAWAKTQVSPVADADIIYRLGEQQGLKDDPWTKREILQIQLDREPRLSYFVFVDDASVESVVDCDRGNDRSREGGYFVTIVQSGLIYRGEDEHPELAEEMPLGEDEEFAEEYWQEFRQRFKAWDLVKVYAAIVRSDWPDA